MCIVIINFNVIVTWLYLVSSQFLHQRGNNQVLRDGEPKWEKAWNYPLLFYWFVSFTHYFSFLNIFFDKKFPSNRKMTGVHFPIIQHWKTRWAVKYRCFQPVQQEIMMRIGWKIEIEMSNILRYLFACIRKKMLILIGKLPEINK